MELKTFLTKAKWGDKVLFRNVRAVAAFILSNGSDEYATEDTLASLIGQVSKGARPVSDNFRKVIKRAIDLKTESWDAGERESCRYSLRQLFNELDLRYLRQMNEEAFSMNLLDRSLTEADEILMVFSETLHQSGIMYCNFFGNLCSRFASVDDSGQISATGKGTIPRLTICVPPGFGGDAWTNIYYFYLKWLEDAKGKFLRTPTPYNADENEEKLLATIVRELNLNKSIQVFEILDTICWSSLVLLSPGKFDHAAFHLYTDFYLDSLNHGEIAAFEAVTMASHWCSPLPGGICDELEKTLYYKCLDPDDHDLRKKNVRFDPETC